MDDNARPHRSRAATTYFQSEAVTALPWQVMSPDLNPIEHAWDFLDVVYRHLNLMYKTYVNWKQHCIGTGGSYYSKASDD
jgi:hypothetical protein